MMRLTAAFACMTALALCAGTVSTFAQEQQAEVPSLLLDLNSVEKSEGGCRLTFVVSNELGAPLDKAAFEFGLFNTAGQVERLTILDFRDLPDGKTKIRRFDLPGTDCASIGRVLVNDSTECAGQGIDAKACIGLLKTESKSGLTFGS